MHLDGIATHDIPHNSEGLITMRGVVGDLNTSLYEEGDILYLSTSSAGSYTTITPNAPYPTIRVGVVLSKHINQGKIIVHFSNPNSLNGLSDVNGTIPKDNYILKYISLLIVLFCNFFYCLPGRM